jgi:uncharacterized protein YjiS (DUF1127 family)
MPRHHMPRTPTLIGSLLARARRGHAERLAHQRLHALDDHLLRDMGLERASIDRALRDGRP